MTFARSVTWLVGAILGSGLALPAHAAPAAKANAKVAATPATCAAATLPAGPEKAIAPSSFTALLQTRGRDTVLSEWTRRYLIVMGRCAPLGAAVYDACLDAWHPVAEWAGAKVLGTTLLLTRWSGRRVIVTSLDGQPFVELDPATRTWSAPGVESRKALAMPPASWVWRAAPARPSQTAFAAATRSDRVSGKQTTLALASPPAPRGAGVTSDHHPRVAAIRQPTRRAEMAGV